MISLPPVFAGSLADLGPSVLPFMSLTGSASLCCSNPRGPCAIRAALNQKTSAMLHPPFLSTSIPNPYHLPFVPRKLAASIPVHPMMERGPTTHEQYHIDADNLLLHRYRIPQLILPPLSIHSLGTPKQIVQFKQLAEKSAILAKTKPNVHGNGRTQAIPFVGILPSCSPNPSQPQHQHQQNNLTSPYHPKIVTNNLSAFQKGEEGNPHARNTTPKSHKPGPHASRPWIVNTSRHLLAPD